MTKLSRQQFLQNLSNSGLISQEELEATVQTAADEQGVVAALVAGGKLTSFQASALRERRFEDLFIGNYQILDRLGAGGMGTVYKARHRRMKRIVAIKVLSRTAVENETFLQRFQREVEAVARLSHPNIVMAYDADEAETGPFLVMEFVDGRDLASVVQQRGRLPVAEAVDCIVQAARAMAYAHDQGIIHRDIKPANLLRDAQGVVKVADLGLARFSERTHNEASALTQAGTIMGTVDFMSPEQALGATNIDHRADIYSLGCTLYYLATGRPPFEGSSLMAILLKHREAPPPSLCAKSDAPKALDEIFQKMVAKKPEDRFGSMSEVVRALESFAQSSKPASAATVEFASASREEGETAIMSAARATVLLVEPSRSQAVFIRGYLKELGYEDVTTALSGQSALESARFKTPQAVVSAMHLSDMSGPELAQKLRSDPSLAGAGFVLITSEADQPQVDGIVRLVKPFAAEQLGQALSMCGVHPGARRPAKVRLLVVDDSAAARRHIRGVLTGLGVGDIKEAADGAEALTLLGKETFDLVVTDYNMPYLDGRALVDFIRNRSATPSVPIIMVTTETDPEKLDAVRELGVAAICDKTFNPATVKGVLDKLR